MSLFLNTEKDVDKYVAFRNVKALVRCLTQEHQQQQPLAWLGAHSALRLMGSAAVPELSAALDNHGQPFLRQTAATLLGEIADARAVDPLVRAALKATETPEVRRAAFEALPRLQQPRAADALAHIAQNGPREWRAQAAAGLGQLGDHRAVATITAAAQDADETVRAAALAALDLLGHQAGGRYAGWTYYLGQAWNLSLCHPPGWVVLQENAPAKDPAAVVAAAFAAPESAPSKAAVIVMGQRAGNLGSDDRHYSWANGQYVVAPPMPKDYSSALARHLGASLPHWSLERDEDVVFCGLVANRLTYTYDGQAGRIEEVSTTIFGRGATQQIICKSPEASFPQWEATFGQVVDSFRFGGF
jgi:hypothetical protein